MEEEREKEKIEEKQELEIKFSVEVESSTVNVRGEVTLEESTQLTLKAFDEVTEIHEGKDKDPTRIKFGLFAKKAENILILTKNKQKRLA